MPDGGIPRCDIPPIPAIPPPGIPTFTFIPPMCPGGPLIGDAPESLLKNWPGGPALNGAPGKPWRMFITDEPGNPLEGKFICALGGGP